RMVGLMALRSHLLSALRFADYRTGELTLAQELWRELPDNSLTIVDRNFLVADHLTSLTHSGTNRHWMTRAKSTTRLKTLRRLARATNWSKSSCRTRPAGCTRTCQRSGRRGLSPTNARGSVRRCC